MNTSSTVEHIRSGKQGDIFYELFHSFNGMLSIVDKELNHQFVNKSYCDYWLVSEKVVSGTSVQDLFGETEFSKVSEYYELALTGQSVTFEVLINFKRLGIRKLHCSLIPRLIDGQFIQLFSCFIDISDSIDFRHSSYEQHQFQQFFSEFSNRFLNVQLENIDHEISKAQAEIGNIMNAERCFIFLFNNEKQHYQIGYIWTDEDIDDAQDMIGMVVQDYFPWLGEMMLQQQNVVINQWNDIPENAVQERQYAAQTQIQSFLMIPLVHQGSVLGNIGIDLIKTAKIWKQEDILHFKLLADVIVNALVRKEKESRIIELTGQLESENSYLREEIKLTYAHGDIVGDSLPIQRVLSQLEHVAPTDANVLILGETGTGKELLAHAIHRLSQRNNKPMVSVNCAALPSSLIESELFGREKGAYTGALTKQMGRFEIADQSTLFLDEIGDLPIELQSKLLRVLQFGEFERIGSPRTIKVDVRIIVATNRNLEKMVKEGTFREDLYYRLNVFPITVPPLRERADDIPLLVWAIIKELEKKLGRKIEKVTKKSMTALNRYDWPGNIRELRNVIERTMILDNSPVLSIDRANYPNLVTDCHDYFSIDAATGEHVSSKLDDVEMYHILRILEKTHWRVRGTKGAAELLGLKPTTLESKMKRLGIKRDS